MLSVDEYTALKAMNTAQRRDALLAALARPDIAGTDEITLLAVPDSVLLEADDSSSWVQLWGAMLDARQGRTALFCLMDTPASLAQAVACRQAFRRDDGIFGAAYWPHLQSR